MDKVKHEIRFKLNSHDMERLKDAASRDKRTACGYCKAALLKSMDSFSSVNSKKE